MNEYIGILKELLINFSYQRFLELLKEIDSKINENNGVFGEEFLFYFNQIINFVNDDYIVDNEVGTLGHMLVEKALLNKEKLTPSLILCFFLEQKSKLGLDEICNEVVFGITRHMANDNYRMSIVRLNDINSSYLSINFKNKHYKNYEKDIDTYNYVLMSDILHELTHVYQLSKSKTEGSTFERLARYDYEICGILNNHNPCPSNTIFHASLVCEFMANEQARVYLLNIAEKHPEYFNLKLIEKERADYASARLGLNNGKVDEYLRDVRVRFNQLISDMRVFNANNREAMKILEEIDVLMRESLPLVDELKRDGISERIEDDYYNIFLKSLYHFDGEKIVLVDTHKNSISKII